MWRPMGEAMSDLVGIGGAHALAAGTLFFALSAGVGEWFPFTRVPMYSGIGIAQRTESAVPIARIDGVRGDLEGYDRFQGPDAGQIEPWQQCRDVGGCKAFPSSDPVDVEMARWVREHPARPSDAEGPAKIEVGYVWIIPRAGGGYDERFEAAWRGTAWPRGR